MAVDVTYDVDRFDEALDWFLSRVPMTRAESDALTEWSRTRAFWISGVSNARMIQDVRDSLAAALERGDPFNEWRPLIQAKLRNEWTLSEDASSARLALIYRNASMNAYNKGRHEQMTDPDVLDARPWWMYDAIIDGRTSNICRPLDGTIKRSDDEFWVDHHPPLHHACRSGVTTLDDYERQELLGGGETRDDGTRVYRNDPADDPLAEPPQDGFGAIPTDSDSDETEGLDPDLQRDLDRQQS